MRFIFDQKKTTQAAAQVIFLHGGRLNYMKLIKLLYLADRESLIDRGMPITGDAMVSMPHGPVLSNTLNLINEGEHGGSRYWYESVTGPSSWEVGLVHKNPATDLLSRYEVDLLEKIVGKFRAFSQWDLRDFTHDLPEWGDPDGSSYPIEPKEILEAAGATDEEIRRYTIEAEELWRMKHLAENWP